MLYLFTWICCCEISELIHKLYCEIFFALVILKQWISWLKILSLVLLYAFYRLFDFRYITRSIANHIVRHLQYLCIMCVDCMMMRFIKSEIKATAQVSIEEQNVISTVCASANILKSLSISSSCYLCFSPMSH